MKRLVVFGAGGFGQEAIWVAESMNEVLPHEEHWEVLGYIDDDRAKLDQNYYGYPVVEFPPSGEVWFYCAVGHNGMREQVATRLESQGWRAATLIHPSVIRARYVEIGGGTYVGAGSILSPNARIGRHVLINQRVSIGHDAVLEDFSQACPGAQINGNCRMERGAFVGSNASVHQGRTVGSSAIVGANSQVIKNVRPRTTVSGVPARLLSAPA